MAPALSARYQTELDAGRISPDPAQAAAVAALERLCADLAAPPPCRFAGWLGQTLAEVRGVYLHGPVGRGKTMLMDLLCNPAPVKSCRRVHFHPFMQEVHRRLHGEANGRIDALAKKLAAETRLLCLDEFQVTNVADAMIMARLFGELFARGLVLVATSNVAPEHLYEGGLQRSLFLPFIEVLKRHCDSVAVMGAEDYRRRRLRGTPCWFCPPDEAALARAFATLTDGAAGEEMVLDVSGKRVVLPRVAHGVALLPFAQMNAQTLWIPEFEALADCCPTLLLSGLGAFAPEAADTVRRFMAFIDVWYDRCGKLMVSSDVAPDQLYPAGPLAREFERTVSRLVEMQGEEWWGKPVRMRDEQPD